MKLHIIQAQQGDSLLLEFESQGKTTFLLVDGGPDPIYSDHLNGFLSRTVGEGRIIERVLLSHVDDDHVQGLLELFGDLSKGVVQYKVGGLWHNTFSEILGEEVEKQLLDLTSRGFLPQEANYITTKPKSIAQGDQLTTLAEESNIPVNPELGPNVLFSLENLSTSLNLGDIQLTLLGPTQKALDKLRKDWLKWLTKRKKDLQKGIIPRDADASVPNLSSIMFLIDTNKKRILLTGDGRSDHLMQNLRKLGLLKTGGKFHVDILKLPHHGSARNASLKFFQTVTADKYIISANGMYSNPEMDVLVWIAQSAKADGRKIEFLITNETITTRKFRNSFNPDEYGYKWTVLPEGGHAISLDIDTGGVTFDLTKEIKTAPIPSVSITQPVVAGGVSSSRRALLVGINNFPNPAWQLRGCVNDALDMKDLLTRFYSFKEADIHLVTDKEATGQRIKDELSWLSSGFAGGDVRVFAFSSHGSQVDDQSGDEWEGKDEIIIPYDHSWSNPFRDDDLSAIFKKFPDGVNFTFLADCCHSGTIQKALLESDYDPIARFIVPPADVEERILAKQQGNQSDADKFAAEHLMDLLKEIPQDKWIEQIPLLMDLLRRRYRENRFGSVETDRQILLAACQDKQTSADARIEGTYRGAFTWAFGKAIREANGNLNYEQAMRNASDKMKAFTQIPQLECPTKFKNLRLFSA